MTDKELRKLGRRELLQLLVAQGQEAEKVEQELAQTQENLAKVEEGYERLKNRLDDKDAKIQKLRNRLDDKDAKIQKLRSMFQPGQKNEWIPLEQAPLIATDSIKGRERSERPQKSPAEDLPGGKPLSHPPLSLQKEPRKAEQEEFWQPVSGEEPLMGEAPPLEEERSQSGILEENSKVFLKEQLRKRPSLVENEELPPVASPFGAELFSEESGEMEPEESQRGQPVLPQALEAGEPALAEDTELSLPEAFAPEEQSLPGSPDLEPAPEKNLDAELERLLTESKLLFEEDLALSPEELSLQTEPSVAENAEVFPKEPMLEQLPLMEIEELPPEETSFQAESFSEESGEMEPEESQREPSVLPEALEAKKPTLAEDIDTELALTESPDRKEQPLPDPPNPEEPIAQKNLDEELEKLLLQSDWLLEEAAKAQLEGRQPDELSLEQDSTPQLEESVQDAPSLEEKEEPVNDTPPLEEHPEAQPEEQLRAPLLLEEKGEEADEKKAKRKKPDPPTLDQLKGELKQEEQKKVYNRVFRNTIFVLLVVAAVAVVVAVLMFPVLEIKGPAMQETLQSGDIVVTMKASEYAVGDLIAFYYNNTLMVKRIVAVSSDSVELDRDGNVFVNGDELEEPYVTSKMLGNSTIRYPYRVPESSFFVLSDFREAATDSRNADLGCVMEDQIVGKVLFRVWPLETMGTVS